MKKILIILGIIIVVLAALAGAAWFGFSKISSSLFSNALGSLKVNQLQHEGGGFLNEVKGTVTVDRSGASQPAQDGFKLQDGDTVKVSADGSAVIVWSGYGRSMLAGGTTLKVDNADGQNNGGQINVKLEMQAGRMWTRLQKLLSTGSDFSVQSSNVVATVRGTSFGTQVKNGSMNVEVMESHVGMAAPGSANEAMVGPHQTMTGVSTPRAMTDAEVNDSFVTEGNRTMQESEYLAPISLQRVLDSISFPFYGMSKEEFVSTIAQLPDITDLKAQYPQYFTGMSDSDLQIYQHLIDEARAWASAQGTTSANAPMQLNTEATFNVQTK